MGRAQRFEELIAWQKARLLTKAIYEATRTGLFAKDFGLSGQIQRASVSIMSISPKDSSGPDIRNFCTVSPLLKAPVRRSAHSSM